MEGYYTGNDKGTKGTLHVSVTNLPEFQRLIEQADEEARQLTHTLNELRNFKLDIKFDAE